MGRLSEKVRRGAVVGPRRRTFTLDGWDRAYAEFSSGDATDGALYMSGKHICAKLAAIRTATEQSSLSRLSTKTRVKALVSAANHQLEALELQLRARAAQVAATDDSGEVDILDLATVQVELADGVSYNAGTALGSILDGILIPVVVALNASPAVVDDSLADVDWGDVRIEINLGIMYKQAESLWEDCVWNSYVVGGTRTNMMATPLQIDAKHGIVAAAARKIALGVEATSYAIRAVASGRARGLAPRVKGVRAVLTDGDQPRIQFGQNELDPHSQAMLFALRTMACPPYYDSLLDESQPLLAGATLSRLFDGWIVLSQAARLLWEAKSAAHRPDLQTDPDQVADMREYVPFFARETLVEAVHEATGMPLSQASAVVEFLTFRGKERQEFWTQPLVCAGDASKLYPVFGAIAVPPNLRFVLERWMAQLKVDLEQRGTPFEEYLRASLAAAVAASPLLSQVAKVVPRDYTFRCADKSFGQIDAIFSVGSRVFVIEAKCILEPIESSSIGTYRSAIEGAVQQAKTRVKLIEEHRAEFVVAMKQFGWHLPPDFSVHPLVAVSTTAHVGVPWDGVPVVDDLVLGGFFAGGHVSAGLSTVDLSVVQRTFHPFYDNASEAEAIATRYFEQPPQLEQYGEALNPREVPLHAVSAEDWSGVMIDFEQG